MKKILFLFCFTFFFQNQNIAQYVYGDDDMSSTVSLVQPPLENEAPTFSDYTVASESSSILEHSSGTKIVIPANAFIDKNGNLVEGKVDIKFREFTNPLDIYLSGIPMTVDQGGKKEFFQSAGMVEIRVSQNGEEVFPNPDGEMIMIEMTSNQLEDDFQLYNLDESTGEWMEEGKDEVLWNSNNLEINSNNNPTNGNTAISNLAAFPRRPFLPTMRTARIAIYNNASRIKKYNNKLHFRIEVTSQDFKKYKKEKISPMRIIKPFFELTKSQKTIWFYDGKNKKEARQFLTKIRGSFSSKIEGYRDSIAKYKLEDIVITPNLQQDNYNIKIICKGITKTLQAYPYFKTSDPSTEQKRNEKFYKYYQENYQKRCVEWKRLEAIHQEKIAEYEILKVEYDSLLKLYNENRKEYAKYYEEYRKLQLQGFLSADQKQKGVTRRQIPAFTFGILNIDKIMKKLDQRMLVEFKNEKEILVNYSKVIVFDETNNALLTYYPNEKIRFDQSAKNSLLVILDDQMVAMIRPNIFKKKIAASKGSRKRQSFQITPFEKEILDKKMISDVLANN